MMLTLPLLLELLASFVFWVSLYFAFCQLNPSLSKEWHCREVTFIHAVTVICLAGWCGFVQGPWPFTHPGGISTFLQKTTLIVCLGYFFFDVSWCLYFKTEGPVMLLHHIFSIIGLSGVLLRGYGGTEMIAAIFGAELSNPFLQLRWFLRSTGRHKTWYAEVNDIVFMSIFTLMRLVIGTSLLYCYLLHPKPDALTKFCATVFYLIGIVFWIMIVRYAYRKYTKMYRLYKVKEQGNGDTLANNNCDVTSHGGKMNGHVNSESNQLPPIGGKSKDV